MGEARWSSWLLERAGVLSLRNRRLIVDGSWLRLMRQTPLTQLARVQVDIDSSLDHEWRIGVKKDSAELPLVVRTRLKEIIDRIDLQARRPFTKRGTTRASAERFPFWSRVKDGDNISFRISLENPVISEMLSEMSEEQKDTVRQVLTLVSASLPLRQYFRIWARMVRRSRLLKSKQVHWRQVSKRLLDNWLRLNFPQKRSEKHFCQ